MSPKLNHENLGSVQKTAYLTATITTVDSEFDTACFGESGKCPAGTDIPIFYHCQYEEGEEPAQRDNGALEGAAGAFSEDDEVIVQCEITGANQYKVLRVMGFTDKPKVCEFYIDVTINTFIPAYYKTVKLIDNDGMVHIKDSSIEEPSKVGPFSNVAFPAKVYLYMVGNAPIITDNTDMLFSYFTEDPVKEFTVRVETWQEGATIAVNGIVLGNGDQQKFSWNFTSKVWSPVSGGVDKNTTKFMASKTNPSSTGYNQACKKEVVNAYEGTRILLTGEGEGNPQTMGEIYDYLMSAKKVSNSFYHCDLYKPYYGLLENEPIYGPPFETELEEYYRIAAWRVPYLLADDETINVKPEVSINFTAYRLGSLMVKDTLPPQYPRDCGVCDNWEVIEKTWVGNPEEIKYNSYPNFTSEAYLITAIMGKDLGGNYSDTPHECHSHSIYYNCSPEAGPEDDWMSCSRRGSSKIGEVVLSQLGIMTNSEGQNPVFEDAIINVSSTQRAICQMLTWEGDSTGEPNICEYQEQPAGTTIYEFSMISTPEHRI